MKSLNKILDIIEALSTNTERELTLSELCDLTGVKKSTANRILSTLVIRGYVNQKKKRGKYSINTYFININLDDKNNNMLRERSLPYLVKLGNKIKENLLFAVPHGNDAHIIAATETKNVLTTLIEVGTKIHLYCSAPGKIFLAYLEESELDEYLRTVELKSITPNTITDPTHLKVSLKMIKEEGVAYDDEEKYFGIKGLAVPVRDTDGKVIASLGIIGPSIRLTREKMSMLLPDVKNCAQEISKVIS
jgi:DNA-binding IclR family transcriptional regulator